MERFVETLTALIMQYEDEIEPAPERSPAGVLKYLMEERGLRQIELAQVLGSKWYVSQILSGHRPIGKDAARKLAEFFHVSQYSFASEVSSQTGERSSSRTTLTSGQGPRGGPRLVPKRMATRRKVTSSNAALANLSIGDFPLLWITSVD